MNGKSTALRKVFPFLQWIHELKDPRVLRADVVAGITVALVLIPQSMAYAQLAGLPPYYGLYAAFLPPAIAALWGSSRQLATGPVAMVSLMTGAALLPFAAAGHDVVPLAIGLALLAGVLQLLMGFLRLGFFVDFLSHPVLIGVTNAAAVVIATSQLDKFLGVRAEKAAHHYESVWNILVSAAQGIHLPALGMGLLALALMILAKRVHRLIPGVLVSVVVTTVLSWWLGYHQEVRIPPESLQGSGRIILHEYREDRKRRQEMEPVAAKAKTRHEEMRAAHGDRDARTVQAHLAHEQWRLSLETLVREEKAHWNALRELRFRRVEENGGAFFHAQGEVPAGVPGDGPVWRFRGVDNDGQLRLVAGGNVVGHVPGGLPAWKLPNLSLGEIWSLLSSVLVLSLIGFVEAISIAKTMALRTRDPVDANQELVGQGLANLAGAFTQAAPVSGSFSRSAVNLSAGALTGFASVVTTLAVTAALLWLTPLLWHLPEATLAAVIMMAVANLFKVKPILHAWKVDRRDAAVSVLTFAVTLLAAPHLDIGIAVGVGLSLLVYLNTTMRADLAVLSRHPDQSLRDAGTHQLATCGSVLVLRFDGRLYFANASHFENRLIAELSARPGVKSVVLAGAGLNGIDATGEETLTRLVERLESQGLHVVLWGMRARIQNVLEATGIEKVLPPGRFVPGEHQALLLAHDLAGADPAHMETCPLTHPTPLAGNPGKPGAMQDPSDSRS